MGPHFGEVLPRRGGSMAPGVNALWGKDLFEAVWRGILRKICIGALPRAPPKGPAPWGPHVGGLGVSLSQRLKEVIVFLLCPHINTRRAFQNGPNNHTLLG